MKRGARGKGIGGHQSRRAKSEIWLTPPTIIQTLGPYDLDPCAAPAPRPWPTAEHHIVEADDGLSQPWFGRVWMNPPYGDAARRWLLRLADHGTGTALIFARTDTSMFFNGVWDRATALLFLRGRLFFHHPSGVRAEHNSGAPSVLIAYGDYDAERLYVSCNTNALPGKFIPLSRRFYLLVLGEDALRSNEPVSEPTWRWLIEYAIESAGGEAHLPDIYRALEGHAKTLANRHWREKVRQVVRRNGFVCVRRGRYRLSNGRVSGADSTSAA